MTFANMNQKNFRTRCLEVTLLVAVALALTATSRAERYVNWNKGYYLELPDTWRIVGRTFVDRALLQQPTQDASMYEYDAFFSPDTTTTMLSTCYVVVNSELDDSIKTKDIRDIIKGLEESFSDNVGFVGGDTSAVSDTKSRRPSYDEATRTVTQVSELEVRGNKMMHTLALKFYKRGMTTISFFTRKDLYEKYKGDISSIIAGFHDEALAEAAPQESVKVVDVGGEDPNKAGISSTPKWLRYVGFVAIPLFAALLAFALIKRRKPR